MAGIVSLVMEHFRGATGTTQVDFNGSPLVVVYGANGTGKSSIADAIALICSRSGGSVGARSSTALKNDLPSAGWAGKKGVSVSLATGSQVWRWDGKFSGKDTVGAVMPESPSPPAVFTLRRANLLRLTEATPAERYRELGGLIDIPSIDANERALGGFKKQADDASKKAQAVYDARRNDLIAFWEEAGNPPPDEAAWAGNASIISENDHALLRHLSTLIAACDAVNLSRAALRMAQASEEKADQKVAEYREAVSDYMEQQGLQQRDLDTLAVLEKTARYLEGDGQDASCPACRQSVELTALRAEVSERLNGLSTLRDLIEALGDAENALGSARSVTAVRRKDLVAKSCGLAGLAQVSRVEAITWLDIQWGQYPSLLNAESEADAEAVQESEDLWAALSRVYSGNAARYYNKPVVEGLKADHETLKERIQIAADIGKALDALRNSEEARDAAQRQLEAWRGICDIVKARRQDFVDTLFGTVVADSGTLYSQIHPNENIRLTKVSLAGPGIGRSLDMQTEVSGHSSAAQAYLSDSHLDTLGFCFWLAVVKHYSQGGAIVVLDDVFSSADLDHQARILKLLQEQTFLHKASLSQVILLTHSQAWRDAAHAEAKAEQPVSLVELAPWTYQSGIRV